MKQEAFEEQALLYLFHSLDEEECLKFEKYLNKASEPQIQFFESMRSISFQMETAVPIQTPRKVIKKQLLESIQDIEMGAPAPETPTETLKNSETTPKKQEVEKIEIAKSQDPPEPSVKTDSVNVDYNESPDFVIKAYKLLKFEEPMIALSAFVSMFILSVILIGLVSQKNSLIDNKNLEISNYKAEQVKHEDFLSYLNDPKVKTAVLRSNRSKDQISGTFYFNETTGKAMAEFNNLDIQPEGKTYQLWVIVKNRPMSLATFKADKKLGARFLKFEQFGQETVDGSVEVALTLEPEGGSTKPTGRKLIAGKF